ncbi:MAG: hypothetical protein L6R41_006162 [Letrouitia leprolyta]|nr:MAG: hypothetical protein L6R41_006162 [Letrouitia leprolyta]
MTDHAYLKAQQNLPRQLWNPTLGNGIPGDYVNWLLWDPSPQEVADLLTKLKERTIPVKFLTNGTYSNRVPRYVRLSDSAVGFVISAQATKEQLKDFWHMDFTVNKQLSATRKSMGHAWVMAGRIAVFKGETLRGDLEKYPGNEHAPSIEVDSLGSPLATAYYAYGPMVPAQYNNH